MFVHRRCGQLRAQGVGFAVRDWQRMGRWQRLAWLLTILFDPRPSAFELHGFETQAMTALVLRPFRKHIVYWLHSGRFPARLRGFRRWLFRRVLATVDEAVLVSPHLRGQLAAAGFQVPTAHRIQHAFLPPPPAEYETIWQSYDASTHAFVDRAGPLLVMQGADGFYKGVDLYGTDLAIEMMGQLHAYFPEARLLIGQPTAGNALFQQYQQILRKRIAALGLEDHIYFLTGEQELWPLIQQADLFLRPTYQDGDSVSVREALHLGTPVVASDACPRPDGVTLFENRNADDLATQVAGCLATGLVAEAAP